MNTDNKDKEYLWYCRFTMRGDKAELYLTERVPCRTFKELRGWWRKDKPNYKLLGAIRRKVLR